MALSKKSTLPALKSVSSAPMTDVKMIGNYVPWDYLPLNYVEMYCGYFVFEIVVSMSFPTKTGANRIHHHTRCHLREGEKFLARFLAEYPILKQTVSFRSDFIGNCFTCIINFNQ